MTARSRGAGASLLTTLTLATIAPASAAHVLSRPHSGRLTLDERAAYQRAVIRHDEGVLRWLRQHPSRRRTLSTLGLAQAGATRDRIEVYHRSQLLWTRRELTETLAAIRARDARRSRQHERLMLARALADPVSAIRYVFGPYGDQAVAVSRCETGGTFSIWAENGQYENIFQMGYNERRTYGWHTAGSPAIIAARAAYRYFVASGRDWGPWTCKP